MKVKIPAKPKLSTLKSLFRMMNEIGYYYDGKVIDNNIYILNFVKKDKKS